MMLHKISLCLYSAVILLTSFVCGSEKMFLQYTPTYLPLSSNSPAEVLRLSFLPDFISAAVGFTPSQQFDFKGLKAGNPFKKPKAVVVTEFDGFHDINFVLSRPQFSLSVDATSGWAYQITADRIYERFPNQELNLIEIVNDDSLYAVKAQYPVLLDSVAVRPSDLENNLFSDKSVFKNKSLHFLNVTNTPDLAFLLDIQLLHEVIEALPSKKDVLQKGNAVDLFWFRFSSIQDLISVYGKDSSQILEALTLIQNVLKQLEKAYLDIYGNDVLILFLAVDYQNPTNTARVRRSVPPVSASAKNDSYNVALDYDENYPAIFNIIFFTMLIISLSVFAIALGTWHMDPGRDSIIYRMTSQRIKKDQ